MPYVVTDKCEQCGICVAGCPVGAITEETTKSEIHPDICIECGTCFDNCPFEAIIFVEEEQIPTDDATAKA